MNDLSHFRDEDLLALARNPVAQARQGAIRQLIKRNSSLASHPDIVAEAAAIVHNEPQLLKQIAPTANFGSALPGVVDVVERTIKRTGQLESRAVQIEATAQEHARSVAATAENLRAQIDDHQTRDSRMHDALIADLSALDDRHETTSLDLSNLGARFEETMRWHEYRLARLERSPLRKFYDWAIVPPSITIRSWVHRLGAWVKRRFSPVPIVGQALRPRIRQGESARIVELIKAADIERLGIKTSGGAASALFAKLHGWGWIDGLGRALDWRHWVQLAREHRESLSRRSPQRYSIR